MAIAVADAATAVTAISLLSVRIMSAPPANEISAPSKPALLRPVGRRPLASRHGLYCDKGTSTGGYVIFWLTKPVLGMNSQVRRFRQTRRSESGLPGGDSMTLQVGEPAGCRSVTRRLTFIHRIAFGRGAEQIRTSIKSQLFT